MQLSKKNGDLECQVSQLKEELELEKAACNQAEKEAEILKDLLGYKENQEALHERLVSQLQMSLDETAEEYEAQIQELKQSHAVIVGELSKELKQMEKVKETLKSECLELTQKVNVVLEDKCELECKKNAVEMQLQGLQVKVTEGDRRQKELSEQVNRLHVELEAQSEESQKLLQEETQQRLGLSAHLKTMQDERDVFLKQAEVSDLKYGLEKTAVCLDSVEEQKREIQEELEATRQQYEEKTAACDKLEKVKVHLQQKIEDASVKLGLQKKLVSKLRKTQKICEQQLTEEKIRSARYVAESERAEERVCMKETEGLTLTRPLKMMSEKKRLFQKFAKNSIVKMKRWAAQCHVAEERVQRLVRSRTQFRQRVKEKKVLWKIPDNNAGKRTLVQRKRKGVVQQLIARMKNCKNKTQVVKHTKLCEGDLGTPGEQCVKTWTVWRKEITSVNKRKVIKVRAEQKMQTEQTSEVQEAKEKAESEATVAEKVSEVAAEILEELQQEYKDLKKQTQKVKKQMIQMVEADHRDAGSKDQLISELNTIRQKLDSEVKELRRMLMGLTDNNTLLREEIELLQSEEKIIIKLNGLQNELETVIHTKAMLEHELQGELEEYRDKVLRLEGTFKMEAQFESLNKPVCTEVEDLVSSKDDGEKGEHELEKSKEVEESKIQLEELEDELQATEDTNLHLKVNLQAGRAQSERDLQGCDEPSEDMKRELVRQEPGLKEIRISREYFYVVGAHSGLRVGDPQVSVDYIQLPEL
ncbi:myosin-9-like [Eleutherodactylus coqui]|uniref:myosin-9-like n=1 Tax=Eleutherodactylus coqui TaxID=57060 RepID=UPI003461AB44